MKWLIFDAHTDQFEKYRCPTTNKSMTVFRKIIISCKHDQFFNRSIFNNTLTRFTLTVASFAIINLNAKGHHMAVCCKEYVLIHPDS